MLPIFLAAVLLQTPQRQVLHTLEHGRLAPGEQVLATTLQGLVGRRSPRVWLTTGGIQVSILDDLRREGTEVRPAGDVWSLVATFRPELKGAILYKMGTPSLNVATGLCGPMGAVAVDESMMEAARANGLPILLDARGMTEAQAYERFRSRYRKGIVVEQVLDKPGHLRDFAVKHSAFVMDARDRDFRRRIAREMGPNALFFGWGRDEHEWVADLSSGGATGVPADWCLNLSALESLPTPVRAPKPPAVKAEDGVRYVAFVMSDGDNIQWLTGGFATDPKFYGSPLRGKLPMTWEVSPLLSRFAPRVLQRIFATATVNDDFVTGPGLPGYTFPSLLPNRAAAARQTAPFLRDSGLGTLSFLNVNDGPMTDIAPWMELPQAKAGIYKEYSPYHRQKGRIFWHRSKPLVSYRFVLWENLLGIDDLVREIGQMPSDARSGQARFALINVHAWSYGSIGGPLEAVRRVIEKLPPNTRVVGANSLLEMIRTQGPAP